MLNTVLLPAMKEVGDKFGAGELILPFVLQSAEVMKKAVARLETYLEKNADVSKGTVVLATVYGDVHDIGKNLVKTILTQQRLHRARPRQAGAGDHDHLEKAKEVDATAIGLSALLVSTSKQMPICVGELHRAGLGYPVLIGGAAINRNFGRRARAGRRRGVLRARRVLLQGRLRGPRHGRRAARPTRPEAGAGRAHPPRGVRVQDQGGRARGARAESSARQRDFKVEVRATFRSRRRRSGAARHAAVRDPVRRACSRAMDLKTLYRLHWGARGSGTEVEKLIREDFEPRRLTLAARGRGSGLDRTARVLRLLPCQSEGLDLVVYDPAAFTPGSLTPRGKLEEIAALQLPAPGRARGLWLSDYFMPRRAAASSTSWRSRCVDGRRQADELSGRARTRAASTRSALFVHGSGASPPRKGWPSGTTEQIRAELALDRRARQALLVRLQRLPRSRRPGQALPAALKPEQSIGVTPHERRTSSSRRPARPRSSVHHTRRR